MPAIWLHETSGCGTTGFATQSKIMVILTLAYFGVTVAYLPRVAVLFGKCPPRTFTTATERNRNPKPETLNPKPSTCTVNDSTRLVRGYACASTHQYTWNSTHHYTSLHNSTMEYTVARVSAQKSYLVLQHILMQHIHIYIYIYIHMLMHVHVMYAE